MKTSLIVILLVVSHSAFAQDDAIGKFFGKYLDDSRFTVVSVSPKMFQLMGNIKWDTVSGDVRETVQKLRSFRMLSTETTPRVFYKEFLSRIDRTQYEDLITVRDKDDDTRFMVKEDGQVIHELLMISVDDKGFTFISFVGDINLDALSKLGTDMDIKGMNQLKNAKVKKP